MPEISFSGWNSGFTFGAPSQEAELPLVGEGNPISVTDLAIKNIKEVEHKAGICEEHLFKLHEVAVRHDCVIAFRPVSKHNAPLIALGHPTKGLNIKGKSSSLGPLYGFIPVQQELSRPGEYKRDAILSANKEIMSCIAKGEVSKAPLELSLSRINYLAGNGIIKVRHALNGYMLSSVVHPEKVFTASLTKQGNYSISIDEKSVEVLVPKGMENESSIERYYTADYDLLFLMPSWAKASDQSVRRSSIKPLAPNESPTRLGLSSLHGLSNSIQLQRHVDTAGAENVNYITTLEERVIADINKTLRGDILNTHPGSGSIDWNLVRHGSDEGNPNTDMNSNIPSTIIAPTALGRFGVVSIAGTEQELSAIIQEARDANYVLTGNRNWFGSIIKTNVRKQSEDFERRISWSSVISSSSSRRGSNISEIDIAVLNAAATRRNSVPFLANLPIRRSSIAPTTDEDNRST
ncbi:anthrax toxin-like adenylyl cyclase domain-containing protein [Pseudomonas sp. FP1740]|uniref:anthrax toxin-like adenylyl cyclase domain-containing protein n=1 Tax=Pseudomonas sp. FP1740 TaxID=2954078 RepID=UPI002736A298|nr:anthrax toxin-like adenylyl cyclase domain-containing protein [Pseudomonas sp. FP1740]WLG43201.1 anthrax toxin-like adenylyl cyclase domain-containing protein [Pseudomonas sp. FP1740]